MLRSASIICGSTSAFATSLLPPDWLSGSVRVASGVLGAGDRTSADGERMMVMLLDDDPGAKGVVDIGENASEGGGSRTEGFAM